MQDKRTRVLVTGANRGLGLEFCHQLLPTGAQIWASHRQQAPGADLSNLLQQFPDRLHLLQLDVSHTSSILEAARHMEAQSPELDLLINNAGIFVRGEQPGSLDDEILIRTMQVNAIGPLLLTQALLPLLRRGKAPKIINITSQLGSLERKRSGGNYSYAASKAALNMFSRALAADLRADGIVVVAVHPGWVSTDMGGQSAPLTPRESVSGMLSLIDRLTPDDSGSFLTWNGQTHPW